jgi:hypothetical protein
MRAELILINSAGKLRQNNGFSYNSNNNDSDSYNNNV